MVNKIITLSLIYQITIKHTIMTKQVLKTRLIGDSSIIVSVVVLKRTEKLLIVVGEQGEEIRCKIRKSLDGKEFILPYGNYSMAPAFYL